MRASCFRVALLVYEMDAVVFGNVTLDIICKIVDDVPRYESLSFDQVAMMPGGCGSNVAVGLAALGVRTALVARTGSDDAAGLLHKFWERFDLDLRYVSEIDRCPTGTSIGLVDHEAQPRFIHTPGANAYLTVDALDLESLFEAGSRSLHIAGFFVLPGVLDGRLPDVLSKARDYGMMTSLDVVRSKRMEDPQALWPCLPYLDYFLCNAHEAWRLTGIENPAEAGLDFRRRGARNAIVKLGREGCWLVGENFNSEIDAPRVEAIDTTGAGDAFAAGMIQALLGGATPREACRMGNAAGAKMVGAMGAVGGWLTDEQ